MNRYLPVCFSAATRGERRALRLLLPLVTALVCLRLALPAGAESSRWVDLLYRYNGAAWKRSLGIKDESGPIMVSDPMCEMTSNGALAETLTRWKHGMMLTEPTTIPSVGGDFWDESWASGVRYVYRIAQRTTYTCTNGGMSQVKTIDNTIDLGAQSHEVIAGHNQAVDSRYDLRYSTPVFLDFQFGERDFKGGLFAGYAADPSRIARSFLRFDLPSVPMGSEGRPLSSLNLWHTRNFASGSVGIQARSCTSTAWTESGIVWSTAPSFAGSATDTQTVAYNPSMGQNGLQWVRWKIHPDTESAYGASATTIGWALVSSDEATPGWAYFAKRQRETGKEPKYLVTFTF